MLDQPPQSGFGGIVTAVSPAGLWVGWVPQSR